MRSTEIVQYPNSATLIGYDAQGKLVSTVTKEEWEIAKQKLSGKPSGTKLVGYIYDNTLIEHTYQKSEYFYDDKNGMYTSDSTIKITLKNSYLFFSNTVYIVPDKENILPIDQIEEIDPTELAFVRQWLLRSKDSGYTKLRHQEKKYAVYKDGAGNDVTLKHSFYMIDEKIYATEPGRTIYGGTAQIKVAVDEEKNFFAFKIILKAYIQKNVAHKKQLEDSLKSEAQMSKAANFLIAHAQKLTHTDTQHLSQQILVMPLFEQDFFNFLKSNKSKFTGQPTQTQLNEYKKVIIILLQITIELILLHKNNIIHRDLKPENILTRGNDDQVEARICDYGFAIALGFACNSIIYSYLCGSEYYLAPELQEYENIYLYPYSVGTDIFAFGKTLTLALYGCCKINENQGGVFGLLKILIDGMIAHHPSERLSLSYVQIMLIYHLWEITGKSDEVIISLLNKYQSSIKTKEGLEFLYRLVKNNARNYPAEFANDQFIVLISVIEKKPDANFLFQLLDKKIIEESFLPNNVRRLLFVCTKFEDFNLNTTQLEILINRLVNNPPQLVILGKLLIKHTMQENFQSRQQPQLKSPRFTMNFSNNEILVCTRRALEQLKEEINGFIEIILAQLSSPTHGP